MILIKIKQRATRSDNLIRYQMIAKCTLTSRLRSSTGRRIRPGALPVPGTVTFSHILFFSVPSHIIMSVLASAAEELPAHLAGSPLSAAAHASAVAASSAPPPAHARVQPEY